MAEILARGWNVAIPEVDMGTDVFVAEDDGGRLTRVQIKTTVADSRDGRRWTAHAIELPSEQFLRQDEPVPLLYAFVIRLGEGWQFIVISRPELRDHWREFQRQRQDDRAAGRAVKGRPSKALDGVAEEPAIAFVLTEGEVMAWGGRDFQRYKNNWEMFDLLMLPAKATATEPDPSMNREPPPATVPEDDRGSGPSGA